MPNPTPTTPQLTQAEVKRLISSQPFDMHSSHKQINVRLATELLAARKAIHHVLYCEGLLSHNVRQRLSDVLPEGYDA